MTQKQISSPKIFSLATLIAILALPHFAFSESKNNIDIKPRRSLIVTELSILKEFTLKRTMDQLASQSGVPGLSGESLFRQWFDIMNPIAEAHTVGGPHCDDEFDSELGLSIFNGFPFTCRPASKLSEGLEAMLTADPLEQYIPITLTNRLDLAPANGAHCGEYRIVYARSSGITDERDRNFLIFEAALPNPHPNQGLKGCKSVAKFWEQLSKADLASQRATRLEKFYYDGLGEFMPVIHINNFGNNSLDAGQIRTNQFMQPRAQFSPGVWSMREFKLNVVPGESAIIHQVTVKTNPFGGLFKSAGSHPLTSEFQDYFLTQIAGLATSDFTFSYEVPDKFNTGQAQLNGSENNYVSQLGGDSSEFGQRIQAKLTSLGSSLTPTQIVARAQALSCAGCHRLNSNPNFTEAQRSLGGGLVFPTSLDFVHTSEREKVTIDGEEAWAMSAVLNDLLLPQRKKILYDYLTDKLKNPKRPTDPIGGRSHH